MGNIGRTAHIGLNAVKVDVWFRNRSTASSVVTDLMAESTTTGCHFGRKEGGRKRRAVRKKGWRGLSNKSPPVVQFLLEFPINYRVKVFEAKNSSSKINGCLERLDDCSTSHSGWCCGNCAMLCDSGVYLLYSTTTSTNYLKMT